MTTHRLRAGAVLAVTALALALVTGCGGNDRTEDAVETALTREVAQQRLFAHLDDTLAALPPGTSLTRAHPELSTGTFGPAHTIPCDDSNTVRDGPLFLTATYWVSGVPRGEANSYHDILVRLWTDRGWPMTDRSRTDTRGVNGESPDGFRLTADVNSRGDLAVAVVSPCFPRTDGAQPGPVAGPDVIERR
ncbi:hypothetical protein ACWDUM_02000 [Rhodococcus sp. NPDC003322]